MRFYSYYIALRIFIYIFFLKKKDWFICCLCVCSTLIVFRFDMGEKLLLLLPPHVSLSLFSPLFKCLTYYEAEFLPKAL